MRESNFDYKLNENDPDLEIRDFVAALQEDSKNPPNQDDVIAALAKAMVDDFHLFEEYIRRGFRFREDQETYLAPAMYKNLVYRAIWKQAARRDPEGWPNLYVDSNKWRELFPAFLFSGNAEEEDYEFNEFIEFEYDISIRNVGSNPAERAKLIHLLMSSFPELLGSRPKLLEVGSSAGHILRALAVGMRLYPTTVMKQYANGILVDDYKATEAVNKRLSIPAEIGESVGVDIWPWEKEIQIREWDEACTLTPKELMAPAVPMRLTKGTELVSVTPAERYKILDAIKNPLVKFVWADITDDHQVAKNFNEKEINTDIFDAAYLPTVLQQQSAAKRQEIIQSAEKKGRHLIVQDFVSPNPDNPTELLFPEDIYDSDWNYKLLVRDHNGIWQEMLIAQTDRCHRIRLGLGRLSVNGKLVSIEDRL